MNYSEMNDAEINRRVAWIVYPGDEAITPYAHRADVQVFHKNGCNTFKDWCNSWADAGPIIEKENISLTCHQNREVWAAIFNRDSMSANKNPLRAAMIVFLMMQEKK